MSAGTMITGNGIPLFALLARRGAVKLEAKGMKMSRGVSVTAAMMQHYGMAGRATATNRERVLARLEADIAAAKAALQPGDIKAI